MSILRQRTSASDLGNRLLPTVPTRALRCRRKFLRFFKRGFSDPRDIAWERGYKWQAHESWHEKLNRTKFQDLLKRGDVATICTEAVRIESRTNLLFSFEKMALRDAVRSPLARKRLHAVYTIFFTDQVTCANASMRG